MLKINPRLIRSNYIADKLKPSIDNVTFFAENNKINRSTLSNALNWNTVWTDKMYRKVMEWLWFSEEKIKEIFKEADDIEYEYKYWEKKVTESEEFKVAFMREYWKELTENDKAILDKLFKEQ